MWWKKYFDILNHLGVDHSVMDRQTADGQTIQEQMKRCQKLRFKSNVGKLVFVHAIEDVTDENLASYNERFRSFTAGHVVSILEFFTTLHGMQMRSSNENSVCPSVKRVDCEKNERKISLDFLYYSKDHLS